MNKKIKLSKGVKASAAFFVANIVTKGISYITTPIFTRMLTTTEYGQVSVYLTWMQIFGIIAMFCLSYGVFNNGMVDYPEKRDEYSFSMLILSNIITLCFSALILCLYPFINNYLKMDFPLLVIMCCVFFFQPAYSFWTAKQRYEYKYKAVFTVTIISSIISPLIAIVWMLLCEKGARLYPRIFGAEITLILIYIVFYVYLGIRSSWKLETKYWKAALLFNLPLIPHYLSTYLLSSSDRIMISYLVSDSATAFYSVAYAIASIALIIWTAINASLVPFTYEKCKGKDYASINKVSMPLLALFAVGCVFVILLAPEAVKIIATSEYVDAIYVIPPIVGGVFFQVQYYLYANIVYYYKKPIYVMIGSIVAFVCNIILNYFCIKQWGYIAAGFTTLICYMIQALIDYLAMRRIVKEKIYNMKFVLILSLVMSVVSVLSIFIYDNYYIRYALLLVLILLAFVFRRKIVSIIRFDKNIEGIES